MVHLLLYEKRRIIYGNKNCYDGISCIIGGRDIKGENDACLQVFIMMLCVILSNSINKDPVCGKKRPPRSRFPIGGTRHTVTLLELCGGLNFHQINIAYGICFHELQIQSRVLG